VTRSFGPVYTHPEHLQWDRDNQCIPLYEVHDPLHYSICAIILRMEWNVETLNHPVDEELNALPADMRARFTRVVRLIESFGVDRVGQPHVKHLQGRLWEMRLRGRDGIARALYVTVTGQRVVVVRVFVKKTQKTPRREIELALERAKEILS
jgi:phage-related protein